MLRESTDSSFTSSASSNIDVITLDLSVGVLYFSVRTPIIKQLSLILFVVLLAVTGKSQSVSLLMGARAQALGNASSCLKDEWSIFNNVGGLAFVTKTTAAFSYHAHPSFKAFNRLAATLAVPTKFGVIGTGVFRYGDNLYNEQILSAGFSNQFGIASLGVKVNYLQYQTEGIGSTGMVTVSMGGIATLTPQLSIGAHITNINQPKISYSRKGETVSTKLNAGLAFKASEKVFMTSEVEKDLTRKLLFKLGVEYLFHPKFIFRTGVNLQPDAAFMGFGFKPKRFRMDYAMGYQSVLGLHHQATVAYQLSK